MSADQSIVERPKHGDVWERQRVGGLPYQLLFSVMHVCGHHEPPHVTGYWHDQNGLNPCRHDSIPLPVFLHDFKLHEREEGY